MLLFQFFMWIRNIINLTSKFSTICNIIFIPLLYNPLCTHFCVTSIDLLPAVLCQGTDTQRYQSFNNRLCFPRLVWLKQPPVLLDLGVPRTSQPFMQLQNLGRMTELHEMQPSLHVLDSPGISVVVKSPVIQKTPAPFLVDMRSVDTLSQVGKGHRCNFVYWLHKKHHQQDLLLKVLLWVFFWQHILMAALSL